MDIFRVASIFLLSLLLYLDIISAFTARRQYGRSELLRLNFVRPAGVRDVARQIPDLIRRCPENIDEEKGVSVDRGGVWLRLRKIWFNRIPLPSMILGNVQSISNILDDLQGNACFLKDYKNCCVMAFTETWLTYEGIIVAKVFSTCNCRFCMRTLKSQTCNSKFEVVNIYFACVLLSHN